MRGDGATRVEVVVRGSVQGVGFRYFVLRQAERLRLQGWVANEPDGTVRLVVEGAAEAVDELLEAVRRGPPAARVTAVEVGRAIPSQAFSGFTVRAGGHRGD